MRPFEAFTWQHWSPILFFILFTIGVIGYANRYLDRRGKILVGTGLAITTWASMFFGSAYLLFTGTYSLELDLPLYLCRVVAWMLPLVVFFQNRTLIGIFYFWIIAGTLQALITPDLAEGFPSYWYFRYWFLHCGLVVTQVYLISVLEFRITWKDFRNAVIASQVYLICVHGINFMLGSNYSYTMHKPPGPSILDVMGPWPWYIFFGELIMFILFVLLMVPYLFKRRNPILQ